MCKCGAQRLGAVLNPKLFPVNFDMGLRKDMAASPGSAKKAKKTRASVPSLSSMSALSTGGIKNAVGELEQIRN